MRGSVAFLAVVAALALAGCGSSPEPFRIGVLTDCTGFFAGDREADIAGLELPLVERGAHLAGRKPSAGLGSIDVGGRPVELVQGCSEAGEYSTLVYEVRKLVENEHVDAVVGPIAAQDSLVLREYARNHPEVAFVIGEAAAQEVTLRDPAPNVFRFHMDGSQALAGLGSYAYRKLGWRTAVTVGDDQASYGLPLVAGFVADFCALGGKIVDRRWTPVFGMDASPLARGLPKADGVFLGTINTAGFLRAYGKTHDLGRELVMAGFPIGTDPTLAQLGSRLDGVVAAGDIPFEGAGTAWRSWLRFQSTFAKTFPGVKPVLQPYLPLLEYDSMKAILEALEQSGGGSSFRRALAGVVLASPVGSIRLDRNRQAVGSVYLDRVEFANGKLAMRTFRTIPAVDQTLGGYFGPSTAPPSRTAPACVKRAPPPWAR